MFQNYIQNSSKEDNLIQEEFWDNYLDKQIRHLVLEYSFDFEKIAQAIKNMKYKNTDIKIDKKKCESRWSYLHLKRKKPIMEETNEQKFYKLISEKNNNNKKEDFNIFDYKSVEQDGAPSGFPYYIKILFF